MVTGGALTTSYTTAREQLVRIVQDVLPVDNSIGEGIRFRHLAEGRDGMRCRSRSFWIVSNEDGSGGIRGPVVANLQLQPLIVAEMTLTISYQLIEKRSLLDICIAADQRAVSLALLTQGNWETATSGIESLTNDPLFMRARRVVGPDSVELSLSFPMTFR